jgi:hypothetical protein
MGLRVEHDFCMPYILFRTFFEVGKGKIVEILLIKEYLGPLIIDVQEILQATECIGFFQLFNAVIGYVNFVSLGDLKHELRFKSAFNVQMQLSFGEVFNEVFHDVNLVKPMIKSGVLLPGYLGNLLLSGKG